MSEGIALKRSTDSSAICVEGRSIFSGDSVGYQGLVSPVRRKAPFFMQFLLGMADLVLAEFQLNPFAGRGLSLWRLRFGKAMSRLG